MLKRVKKKHVEEGESGECHKVKMSLIMILNDYGVHHHAVGGNSKSN